MSAEDQKDVTRVLERAAAGDLAASAQLLPLVYEELRKLAGAMLARTPPGNTLQATALVHEAYLRIGSGHDAAWEGRRHFFFAASRAMRDILVEQARRKGRVKHGGGRQREGEASLMAMEVDEPIDDILLLDDALRELERTERSVAEVVFLRYFSGLTIEESAEVLQVSTPTVNRRWRFAKAWLHARMTGSQHQRDE